jgi:hypothetical protein
MSTRAERAFAPFAYLPWQSPLLAAAATARPGCHDAPTLAGLQSGGAGQGTSRLQAAARGTANFPLVSSSPACPVADGDGFVIHPFPQKGWLGRPGPGEKLFPSIASLVGVEGSSLPPLFWAVSDIFFSFVHGTGGAAAQLQAPGAIAMSRSMSATRPTLLLRAARTAQQNSDTASHAHAACCCCCCCRPCPLLGNWHGSVARKSSLVRRTGMQPHGHTRRRRPSLEPSVTTGWRTSTACLTLCLAVVVVGRALSCTPPNVT